MYEQRISCYVLAFVSLFHSMCIARLRLRAKWWRVALWQRVLMSGLHVLCFVSMKRWPARQQTRAGRHKRAATMPDALALQLIFSMAVVAASSPQDVRCMHDCGAC
jgi:hypothetical protein